MSKLRRRDLSDDPRSPRLGVRATPLAVFSLLLACKGDKESAESGRATDSDPEQDSAETALTGETAETDLDTHDTDLPIESADPCAELSAVATRNHSAGRIPFGLELDGAGSCGPSPITAWTWEIDGEILTGAQVSWTGLVAGEYEAILTVTDEAGASAWTNVEFQVLPGICPDVLDPVLLGELADPELVESSGLIVSRRDEGVLWSHNDSGDVGRLFALGRDGAALGTWTLDVESGDWEDLAWGVDPDSGAPLLFAGDIGDNGKDRETVLVYVLEEPTVDPSAEPTSHVVDSFATLTLQLPELLNMDSMLVDPVTGDLLLISDEEDGRSVILRKPAPHADGDDVTLEVVGELTFGVAPLVGDVLAMGADITPLGDRVVIRTRDEAWLWPRDGAQTVQEALSAEPCAVPLPEQTLGEAIAFDIRDGGLLLTSEGAGEPVYHVPFSEPVECIDTFAAVITATPPGGPLPVDVVFDASASCVPEGLETVVWDIDGDLSFGETATASWLASGSYPVTLTITDSTGARATASTTIVVEPGDCPVDDEATTLATIDDDELVEASGLAVSRLDAGVLWTHNDSGHAPQLFALDRDGVTLGTWTLDAPEGDLEDIAIGYADDGTAEIWLGDVGDNLEEREFITVYRIDEPPMPGGEATDHTVTEYDAITLTWPDGAKNCETLMVDPVTHDLYLVTKSYDGYSDVYRKSAPHSDGESAVLEHVVSLVFGEGALAGGKPTTGGDISPDGAWIVIRTLDDIAYIWPRDRSATIDDAFAGEPCPVVLPVETQGEAICFDTEGDALLTTSEKEHQPIYRVTLTR